MTPFAPCCDHEFHVARPRDLLQVVKAHAIETATKGARTIRRSSTKEKYRPSFLK